MKNSTKNQDSLAKGYVHASGMMLRVGKAVLGMILFGLTKVSKTLIKTLDKTGLPSSTGDTKKQVADPKHDMITPS